MLLPYCFIVRIRSFFNLVPMAKESIPEHLLLLKSLADLNPIYSCILASLLVFIQAFLINYMVNKRRMPRYSNLFPGLIFILLCSTTKDFLILNHVMIASTLLLLAYMNYLNIYKNYKASGNIFNAGLFTIMAAYVYAPSIIFVILGLTSLMVFRTIKLMEILQFIIGILAGIVICYTYLIYIDSAQTFLDNHILKNAFNIPSFGEMLSKSWILLGFVGLLIALSLINYYSYIRKKGIEIHKSFDFLYWILLLCIPSIFLIENIDVYLLFLLFIPLSIFIGLSMANMRNKILAEVIHLAWFILILFSHFQESSTFVF